MEAACGQVLLHLLHERGKRVPIHYELFPVYIDLGFDSGRTEILREYFEPKGSLTISNSPILGGRRTAPRIEKTLVFYAPGKGENASFISPPTLNT
jgi:hypothetical protein